MFVNVIIHSIYSLSVQKCIRRVDLNNKFVKCIIGSTLVFLLML